MLKRSAQEAADDFYVYMNAFDFIESGVEALSSGPSDSRRLKSAVLHIVTGIEVLLKARLCQEHWSLVVGNLDTISREKFECGSFESISFNSSIRRLENICGISLHKHKDILNVVRILRNQIVHFNARIGERELRSVVLKACDCVLEIASNDVDRYNYQCSEYQDRLDDIRKLLGQQEDFVKKRHKDIADRIKEKHVNEKAVVRCPICLQAALAIEDTDEIMIICLFCGRNFSPGEARVWWCEVVQGYEPWAGHDSESYPHLDGLCSVCESREILVSREEPELPSAHSICFECGHVTFKAQ